MARVLVLASTFPRWERDTAPPFVYNLSSGLAEKGHEIHILAPHAEGAATEERLGPLRVHRFRYAPTRFESLCYEGGILQNLRRKPVLWSIVPLFLTAEMLAAFRLIRRYNIELVHAHWFIPQGFVAALSSLLAPLPLIVTGHGGDVLAVRGLLRKRLVSFAAQRADVCTVNSQAMSDAAHTLTGREMVTIPMGVDQSMFRAAPDRKFRCKEDRGFPRILFVGRLVEKKGIGFLIEAMPEVLREYPESTLTIVGDGPERANLENLAKRLGVDLCINFIGSVSNESLPEYYDNSDIFVAPSIIGRDGDSEALGVVILEAAASGVPIAATNVGGIPDIIKDEETGLLVDQKRAPELAEAIIRLAKDDELRLRLSANARRHVEDHFSWDSVTDQFNSIYKDLVGEKETSYKDSIAASH